MYNLQELMLIYGCMWFNAPSVMQSKHEYLVCVHVQFRTCTLCIMIMYMLILLASYVMLLCISGEAQLIRRKYTTAVQRGRQEVVVEGLVCSPCPLSSVFCVSYTCI